MIRTGMLLISHLFIFTTCLSQKNDEYTRWSFNAQGVYLIQSDVGVNTPTSFFNFQDTFSFSGGLSYKVIEKDRYSISGGFNILYFAPQVENIIISNGTKYDFGTPPPRDYESSILRLPITYKGTLMEFIGLNEFINLNFNIPLYRFETIISAYIDEQLIYQTFSIAEKNFISTNIGVEKKIYTKPILFALGGGYNFDLNDFYDGEVTLGGNISQDYKLVTDGPFVSLSISPRKFKVVGK